MSLTPQSFVNILGNEKVFSSLEFLLESMRSIKLLENCSCFFPHDLVLNLTLKYYVSYSWFCDVSLWSKICPKFLVCGLNNSQKVFITVSVLSRELQKLMPTRRKRVIILFVPYKNEKDRNL